MVVSRNIGRCYLASSVALLACLASSASAKDLEVSAAVEIISTDNAQRINADLIDPIRQLETGEILRINGERQGAYSLFEADARLESRQYSELEGQNQTLYLGNMGLFLGTDGSRLAADFDLSSEELLIDQSRGDARDNVDRRNIASATGYLRLGNAINRVEIGVNATNIDFDETTLNNSSQQGGGISYERKVSAASYAGLELIGYRTEYKESGTVFEYRRAALNWEAVLRNLSYSLSAGVNGIGSDDFSDPYYRLSVDYSSGRSNFGLALNQRLTDTSQGSRNDSGFEGGGGGNLPDGELSVIDQYILRSAQLNYGSSGLCSLCVLSVRLGRSEEVYRVVKTSDLASDFAFLGFKYSANSRTDLGLEMSHQSVSYDQEARDYDENRYRLGVVLFALQRRGSLGLFVERIDHTVDESVALTYKVNNVGATFTYLLYAR